MCREVGSWARFQMDVVAKSYRLLAREELRTEQIKLGPKKGQRPQEAVCMPALLKSLN